MLRITLLVLLAGFNVHAFYRYKNKHITNDYVYLKRFDSFYKFYNESAYPFKMASLVCSVDGSTLFFPISKKEAKAVFRIVPPNIKQIWIGAMKFDSNDAFYNLEGEYAKKLNVMTQFQNLNGSRGIKMDRSMIYYHEDLNINLMFVCRKRAKTLDDPDKMLRLITNGYSYFPEHEAAYKFYNYKTSLDDALVRCQIDGTSLFVPKTRGEMSVLRDMSLSGWDKTNSVWIGITKFKLDHFVTLEGKSVLNVCVKWGLREPNLDHDFVKMNVYLTNYSTSDIYGYYGYKFMCKQSNKELDVDDKETLLKLMREIIND